jgi:hypothetical protein
MLHSLRTVALIHQNRVLFHDEHIQLLTSLILTQLHTFAPVLRLAAYSSILDSVIYLLDWSISSASSHLLRFFAFFDRSIFLAKHFPLISTHFSWNIRQIQLLIEEFLACDTSVSSLNMKLFSIDQDLLQARQIVFLFDLIDIHNTDLLKILLNPLLEKIRSAYQRPYVSIDHVRRSIELLSILIHEIYFHSSNFIKDWLSCNLRSIAREGLNFIKMNSVSKQTVSSSLHVLLFH